MSISCKSLGISIKADPLHLHSISSSTFSHGQSFDNTAGDSGGWWVDFVDEDETSFDVLLELLLLDKIDVRLSIIISPVKKQLLQDKIRPN